MAFLKNRGLASGAWWEGNRDAIQGNWDASRKLKKEAGTREGTGKDTGTQLVLTSYDNIGASSDRPSNRVSPARHRGGPLARGLFTTRQEVASSCAASRHLVIGLLKSNPRREECKVGFLQDNARPVSFPAKQFASPFLPLPHPPFPSW